MAIRAPDGANNGATFILDDLVIRKGKVTVHVQAGESSSLD